MNDLAADLFVGWLHRDEARIARCQSELAALSDADRYAIECEVSLATARFIDGMRLPLPSLEVEPGKCPDYPGLRVGGIAWRAFATINPDRQAVIARWREGDRPERLVQICEADLSAARERLAEAQAGDDPERIERCWRGVACFEDKLRRLSARLARPVAPPAVLEGRASRWQRLAKPVVAAIESGIRERASR